MTTTKRNNRSVIAKPAIICLSAFVFEMTFRGSRYPTPITKAVNAIIVGIATGV
jgi:hypothetical protein